MRKTRLVEHGAPIWQWGHHPALYLVLCRRDRIRMVCASDRVCTLLPYPENRVYRDHVPLHSKLFLLCLCADAISTAGLLKIMRPSILLVLTGLGSATSLQLPNPFGAKAPTSSVPASAEQSLALCREAARSKTQDPEAVCEALLQLEQTMRSSAKNDGGALSRATLDKLDGAWRLVFTTGTVETQSKLGRKVNYFPLRATQTFDTSTEPMAITNGIFLGGFPVLKFFGSFEWLEAQRRLEFDFDAIAVLGFKVDLPKGGAEELGAATGLGAKNNVKRAKEGKKAFFNWISADDEVATARGGGGGLALWKRDEEMEAEMRNGGQEIA